MQNRKEKFVRKDVKILMGAGVFLLLSVLNVGLAFADELDSDVVTITADDIRAMNVNSITELLNQTPGVIAGDTSVKLRGSSEVKVFLDGRPINDPLSSHRAIKWNMVCLNNIEKIEIYKGGGAVDFGDGTSGGAICITTKKIDSSQGKVDVFFGSMDTRQYTLNYQHDFSPFGVGFLFDWYETERYRTNYDKQKNQIGLRGSYKQDEGKNFDLSLDYSTEERGKPGLEAYPSPNSRAESEVFSASLLGHIDKIKSSTYFSRCRREDNNPDKNQHTVLRHWTVGENINSSFLVPVVGKINAGFSFEFAHVEGNKISPKDEQTYGLKFSKDIRFDAVPLKLGLGVRGNFYSAFPNVVNPEMKLGYDFYGTDLSFAVSRTNNVPTFLKRYYETSSTQPNPDLGVEKAYNYSFGVSREFSDSFSVNLSVFLNQMKDRITYVRGDDGIGQYENIGEVTRKGFESSIDWKVNSWMKFKPSYSYLVAKDDQSGNWLSARPRHTVKMDTYFKPMDKLNIVLAVKYVSKQFTRSDNTKSVPEYVIADVRTEYSLGVARAFLKVENFTDKSYHYGDGYPAPPRRWLVGMSWEF
ncbi:MAG: TonB-dependent receptor plug domain-containing protein [Candidatus Omnitrophica bacterium]|nr:TonB-dependent receptor plug domain-containing protein [Candidatus Omnitrophota bacterium]